MNGCRLTTRVLRKGVHIQTRTAYTQWFAETGSTSRSCCGNVIHLHFVCTRTSLPVNELIEYQVFLPRLHMCQDFFMIKPNIQGSFMSHTYEYILKCYNITFQPVEWDVVQTYPSGYQAGGWWHLARRNRWWSPDLASLPGPHSWPTPQPSGQRSYPKMRALCHFLWEQVCRLDERSLKNYLSLSCFLWALCWLQN